MIRGTRNQMHNIGNAHQGDTKKVLTVCSAGLLRSATLQNMLIREYGFNVRNCGTQDYALIPISEALLAWADEVIFVDKFNYNTVLSYLRYDMTKMIDSFKKKSFVLNIPDIYNFNDPELVKICKDQYDSKILYND